MQKELQNVLYELITVLQNELLFVLLNFMKLKSNLGCLLIKESGDQGMYLKPYCKCGKQKALTNHQYEKYPKQLNNLHFRAVLSPTLKYFENIKNLNLL